MKTRYETSKYRLDQDGCDYFRLIRKADGHCATFYGSDGLLWDRNMRAIESIKEWNAGNSPDKSFDFMCDGYNSFLDE